LAKALGEERFRGCGLLDLVASHRCRYGSLIAQSILVSQGIKRIRAGRCAPAFARCSSRPAAGRMRYGRRPGFAWRRELNAATLDDMSVGMPVLWPTSRRRLPRLAGLLAKLNDRAA